MLGNDLVKSPCVSFCNVLFDVKEGDVLEITFGQRTLKIKVLTVKDNVAKADAAAMYEVIED